MREALRLTRAQNVIEATRVIQRALAGRPADAPEPARADEALRLPPPAGAEAPASPPKAAKADGESPGERLRPSGRPRRPLGTVLKLLRSVPLDFASVAVRSPVSRDPSPASDPAPARTPDGARYLARNHVSPAGARNYKLFVPSNAEGRVLPLVVMLHGCTQNPDDFAAGTGMNRLAERLGFLVAYPEQSTSANVTACWNWFQRGDQTREGGEPEIIAGITRAVMEEFAVDSGRVYAAGLSAGGAMAVVMGAAYPELFAAVGVHSGLPYAAAGDLQSALAAMRGVAKRKPKPPRPAEGRVRTIVFHGARDKTVDPSNAEAILADARRDLSGARDERRDGVAGGRAYVRTIVSDARGVAHAEAWVVEGLGHAWSGGSRDGSFADDRGPDASGEMLRFFLGRTDGE